MAYVTAEKVAKHFGVTTQSVYVWARQGKIPSYRLGKAVRFVIPEVEEAIRNDVKREENYES